MTYVKSSIGGPVDNSSSVMTADHLSGNGGGSSKDSNTSFGSSEAAKVFNQLLESSKNLPSTTSDLGTIQLSVNEIRRRAHDMRSRKNARKSGHTRAHYLLAGSGLSIEDTLFSLKNLQAKQFGLNANGTPEDCIEPGSLVTAIPSWDAQGTVVKTAASHSANNKAFSRTLPNIGELDVYLKNKKEENILFSIEQLLTMAAKEFDQFANTNLTLDWEQKKEEIKENFGVYMKGNKRTRISNDLDPKLPSWGDNGSGILDGTESRLNVNESYVIREKYEEYAKIIHRFNNARQNEQPFDLTHEFIPVLSASHEPSTRQLLECWKILRILDSSHDVVKSGKTYLESQFLEYIDNLYKKKMNEGLPTNINKIKSFIDTKLKKSNNEWKFNNLTIVNGIPIWALIFYLLRAGLTQDALEVVSNNKSSFKKVEHSFLTYFKAYASSPDHRLPPEFTRKLHTEYHQHIKSAMDGDPYRLAVYKIIGRCDLTRKNVSNVTLSIEDWLWVHLMLIKDDASDSDPAYERYRLEDFQNIIISYGSDRFSNHYCQVLVISGLYEMAVDYLYSLSEIEAVHLAIGLASKNLLNVSHSYKPENITGKSKFITVENNKRCIALAYLLGAYTKSFKFTDTRIAAEYLILITLVDTKEQTQLCHEALRELVLETKEFTILLGKIKRDGERIPGVLEERKPLLRLEDSQEYLHTITEQAARRADEDGRIYDSFLLYQLSEDYDVVVTIVNDLLSDMLSSTDLSQPLNGPDTNPETNPIILANRVMQLYIENAEISKKIFANNKETCFTLLKLAEIRQNFNDGQWQLVLSQIEELDLLPFGGDNSIRRKAQEFSSLNPNIVKSIANLLVITLKCITNMVHQLKQSEYHSEAKEQQILALKTAAKNCMIYAGMVQYRMPRETYSTLISMDVSL